MVATVRIAAVSVEHYTPPPPSSTARVRIAEVSLDVLTSDVPQPKVRIARVALEATSTPSPRVRIAAVGASVPPKISAPVAQSVEAGQIVTVTALGTNVTEWEWEQVSGPAVAFSSTAGRCTFTAPRLPSPSIVTLRVRGAIGGEWSDGVTVDITVARHPMFLKTSSGIQPLRPGKTPPKGAPTEGLPFELPDMSSLPRKVWAHYFGPYPRSLNNAATIDSDTYLTSHNSPYYSGSTNWKYKGGHFRNRPIFRPPIAGDWKYQDCVFDVQTAKAVGIDGFVCDLLGLSGTNYDNYMTLIRAAHALDNGIKVIPMVDGNGATAGATPELAADHIRKYAGWKSSHYLPDGRFLVMSYKGEAKSVDWWNQVGDELRNTWGIEPAFWLVFNDHNQSAAYASGVRGWVGSGVWGRGSDPAVIDSLSNQVATAHGRGELYCHPIQPQNLHLTASTPFYDEAMNTGALRAGWRKAIREGADAVQLVTWSDYSEGGEYAPSAASGMANLDLSAFYMTKWKTGEYPPILRDAGYLSYKSTLAGTTYTAPEQTTFMYQRALSGRSAVSYLVELLLFLTAPAHVVLRIGSARYEYDATPDPETGIHIATRAAQAGAVSFEVTRGGQLVTEMAPNVQIRSVHATDNPGYFRFSTLRSRAGQFDPLAQFI